MICAGESFSPKARKLIIAVIGALVAKRMLVLRGPILFKVKKRALSPRKMPIILEKKIYQTNEKSTLAQPSVRNARTESIMNTRGIRIRLKPVGPSRCTGVTAIKPPKAQQRAAVSAAAYPINAITWIKVGRREGRSFVCLLPPANHGCCV